MRRCHRFALYRRGVPRTMPAFALRDLGIDRLGLTGDIMFDGLERGMIIAVDTISFPFVGEVDGFGETFIRLKNAVKILWDGRHGEYAAGKPPTTAEIEKTYPLYTISADAIIGWGRYPGGKIPEPR